jgi:hypothetical protein
MGYFMDFVISPPYCSGKITSQGPAIHSVAVTLQQSPSQVNFPLVHFATSASRLNDAAVTNRTKIIKAIRNSPKILFFMDFMISPPYCCGKTISHGPAMQSRAVTLQHSPSQVCFPLVHFAASRFNVAIDATKMKMTKTVNTTKHILLAFMCTSFYLKKGKKRGRKRGRCVRVCESCDIIGA